MCQRSFFFALAFIKEFCLILNSSRVSFSARFTPRNLSRDFPSIFRDFLIFHLHNVLLIECKSLLLVYSSFNMIIQHILCWFLRRIPSISTRALYAKIYERAQNFSHENLTRLKYFRVPKSLSRLLLHSPRLLIESPIWIEEVWCEIIFDKWKLIEAI